MEKQTHLHFDEPVTRTQELMNLLNGDEDAVLEQLAEEYREEQDKKKRFFLRMEYNTLAAVINGNRGRHIYSQLK